VRKIEARRNCRNASNQQEQHEVQAAKRKKPAHPAGFFATPGKTGKWRE
jgi:hypothetical protein